MNIFWRKFAPNFRETTWIEGYFIVGHKRPTTADHVSKHSPEMKSAYPKTYIFIPKSLKSDEP